jgi:single-strand DNA-binding protein
MARSLNRVQLIGNLTRDPELRYTPAGTAVCSFSIATNRSWTTDAGEKKDEADFHRIVAWNKLAELCSQFLTKGRKVYVEGRLSTRNWQAQDGAQRSTTEVIISDMILLDSAGGARSVREEEVPEEPIEEGEQETPKSPSSAKADAGLKETKSKKETKKKEDKEDSESEGAPSEEVAPDDIPF